MERQNIYGWPVAIDLFLAGAGGGVFLTGFALNLFGVAKPSAGIMLWAGLFLVLGGSCFLLADITIRSRIGRLFVNRKSWTSRGVWILVSFIVSGTIHASAAAPPVIPLSFPGNGVTAVAGVVAALFSLLVILYPGFLMSTIRAVPFWNTPLLPLLFLPAALSQGLAVAILIALAFPAPLNGDAAGVLHLLSGTAVLLTILQAAALAAFLARASRGRSAARESLELLTASRFPERMFVLGLLAPFLLLAGGIFTGHLLLLRGEMIFAAALLLAGGLYLRYALTQAGVYVARFTI